MASKAKFASSQTHLIFHRGLTTIGGTIIEVQYQRSRLFFDMGLIFNTLGNDPKVSIEQLVDEDITADLDVWSSQRLDQAPFDETVVFISHVHLDHTQLLADLAPELPVYMTQQTKNLLIALQQALHFINRGAKDGQWMQKYRGLASNAIVQVGEITVQLLPVDHDAYGACGLKITTPDATIAYSGDLRLHGFEPELTRQFARAVRGCDVLLLEGVGVSFDSTEEENGEQPTTETELIAKFVNIMHNNSERLLMFNSYPANCLRFYHLLKQSPRPVVLEATMAYVMQEVMAVECLYYSSPETPSAIRQALNPELVIEQSFMLQSPSRYLWQVDPPKETIINQGVYIHSNAVPLGDYDPNYAPFLANLAERNIEFVNLSVSGHATEEELVTIIQMIQPQLLIPIHSLKPERLDNPYGERLLPSLGQSLIVPT